MKKPSQVRSFGRDACPRARRRMINSRAQSLFAHRSEHHAIDEDRWCTINPIDLAVLNIVLDLGSIRPGIKLGIKAGPVQSYLRCILLKGRHVERILSFKQERRI